MWFRFFSLSNPVGYSFLTKETKTSLEECEYTTLKLGTENAVDAKNYMRLVHGYLCFRWPNQKKVLLDAIRNCTSFSPEADPTTRYQFKTCMAQKFMEFRTARIGREE